MRNMVGETHESKQDLDLRIESLPENRKGLYYKKLFRRQKELMPGRENVGIKERYEFLEQALNEEISQEVDAPQRENPYGVDSVKMERDFERYGRPNKGAQENLDSSDDEPS